MIWILLKLQLHSVFYSMFASKAKKSNAAAKAGKGIGFGFLALYLVAVFAFFFGTMFQEVAKVLIPAGQDTAYFSIVLIISALFGIIGSVFITEKTLFGAEDNEFLLSLPFRPSQILLSRLISLYVITFAYGLLVFAPAAVVYAMQGAMTLVKIGISVLTVLLIPLVALSITVIFAWLFAEITRKTKHKNLLTTGFSLIFLVAYLYFYMNLQGIISYVASRPELVLLRVRQFAVQLYFGADALGSGSLLSTLIFIAAALLPAIVVLAVLSRSFLRIATASRNTAVYRYKKKNLKMSSVGMAMLKKELSRIFGTPAYFINACFGAFLLVILAGLVAVKGDATLSLLPVGETAFVAGIGADSFFSFLLVAASSSLCLLTNTSAVALSLEGVNFDVLKSLPLSYRDIVMPKVAANMVIGYVPALLLAVIALIRCRLSILTYVCLFAVPLLAQLSAALWGMIANITFPKFDWTSEVTVIKQSASSMVSVFGGMGLTALYVILAVVLLMKLPADIGVNGVLLSSIGFFLVITLINYLLLMTVSRKKYKTL